MSAALSRVHAFKRVGDMMNIAPSNTSTTPTVLNGTGSGAFPYLQVGAQQALGITGVASFGGAFTFQLSQCANVNDITNLFDNYRIAKVVLRFDYTANQAPSGAGGASGGVLAVPLLHICPDYDDNSIPTARTSVLENGYVRTVRLDRPFTMTLTPRGQNVVATGVGTSTVGVGGLMPVGAWLDTSVTNTPHFGVKFWLDDMALNQLSTPGQTNSSLRITPTYYIEAKNVI